MAHGIDKVKCVVLLSAITQHLAARQSSADLSARGPLRTKKPAQLAVTAQACFL
jgi:hypothetical protein